MPPVTSRRHFRRIVYQRTMFWWPYYSQLWPLVNSLTENSSFFRIRRHAPGRLSGDRVEPITHQRCRSTNRVTCIMSNASSIMSIVRMICLLQPSSLLFRTFADTSLQRTGLVYSPLRGDVATYQPKLIAEERRESSICPSPIQVWTGYTFDIPAMWLESHESKRVRSAAKWGQNRCKISPRSQVCVMSPAFYTPLKSRHKKRSGRYHFVLVTTAPIIAFLWLWFLATLKYCV